MNNDFRLFFDIDIEKASGTTSTEDDNRYDNMIFSGVASDASRDSEGESLDPNGFDYSRFLKSGLINLDHLTTRSPINKSRFWIGEPIDAYVKDGKFFVKGKLWKKSPEARAFWDKALEMRESGSNRKPGMSIEGKALERDPKNPSKVTKALITNLALTMTPVNTKTYVDIEKSRNQLNSGILFETKIGNKIIQVNDKLDIITKSCFMEDIDQFWTLYKSFCRGDINQNVLKEFVKKKIR